MVVPVNASERSVYVTSAILAFAVGIFTLRLMVYSLGWEYSRDTPLLNYVGFLIWEHGFAPYKDVFETSMPGTLAFHSLVAGLGLTSNLGFMILTSVIILSFSLLGALAVLPLGAAGTMIAFPLLASAMLIMGPGWIMKIDMVALLPISAALWCATWRYPGSIGRRQFLIGVLFGIAGTMKPHLVLGAPVVVLTAYALEHWSERLRDLPFRPLVIQIALSLLGFAIPILLVLAWLVSSGAYDRFIFVLTDYLPLHLEKTDWQEFLPSEQKRQIIIDTTLRFGGHYPLVPAAALTPLLALAAWRRLETRQIILVTALGLLAALYGLAPALGGQFYIYYYFPFFYFSLLLIASSASLVGKSGLPPFLGPVWILCLAGFLAVFGSRYYSDSLFHPDRLDNVARMEAALERWLPDGGKVQPIDWTSGVVHAMLRQQVLPATPFLYDYHFHHHVGSRINEELRVAFMDDLEENPPEMFMAAKAFPKVSGLNTSDSFPARDAFLAQGYRVVENDDAFVVYLRNDLGRP